MTSIKAHFDGRVLVPEEPVSLPVNQTVELCVQPAASGRPPLMELVERLSQFPDNPASPADLAARHDRCLRGTPKRP